MSQQSIFYKIGVLLGSIYESENPLFEERDVVYLLVEMYKVKERDLKSKRGDIKKEFPHLAFFRDWVVHTQLDDNAWFIRKEELNNKAELLKEILLILDDDYTKEKLQSLWESVTYSLDLVVQDQDILQKVKL